MNSKYLKEMLEHSTLEVVEKLAKDRCQELFQVLLAAEGLRKAQKAYMAKRGNEDLGRAVSDAASKLDEQLVAFYKG